MNKNVKLDSGSIIENREVAKDHFIMSILLSTPCDYGLPGQFIMMRRQGVKDPLLSRPLSIHGFYQTEAGSVLDFLYRVVGKGTLALSRLSVGEKVDVLGPLGKPFTLTPECLQVILIAGGIGVAPLAFYAEYLSKNHLCASGEPLIVQQPIITFYLGAVTDSALLGLKKVQQYSHELKIATDDGSSGYHGTVTAMMEKDLDRWNPDTLNIFACGPNPMIKSLAEILKDFPAPCQVSLEERMACGIGACLGCSVKLKRGGIDWTYGQVCTDGPVFDIRDIIWSDP